MEVTPVGWFCLLAGVTNLLNTRRLACLVAASATFSATAVVNFPGVPFGFQPYHWFGGLLIANVIVFRPRALLAVIGSGQGSRRWLLAFLAWGVMSMVVSATWAQSSVHLAHLFLGAGILIVFGVAVSTYGDLLLVMRAFVIGAVFSALWGILQSVFLITGLGYPAHIFNNSVGEFAGGYSTSIMEGVVPRISSVATEPSTLVRSLVPALMIVLLVPAARVARTASGKFGVVTAFSACALLATSFLSTSTTALVGLVVGILAVAIVVPRYRWKCVGASVLLAGFFVIVFESDHFLVALFEEMVSTKLELGSGLQRLGSIEDAFSRFLASPVIGAGPGLVTSDDFVVKLLANYGVIGTSLFLGALAATLLAARQTIRQNLSTKWGEVLIGLTLSNVVLWAMDAAAGLSYTYGVFWTLWALLAAAAEKASSSASLHGRDGSVRPHLTAFDVA